MRLELQPEEFPIIMWKTGRKLVVRRWKQEICLRYLSLRGFVERRDNLAELMQQLDLQFAVRMSLVRAFRGSICERVAAPRSDALYMDTLLVAPRTT
jgi:hypothetical protein